MHDEIREPDSDEVPAGEPPVDEAPVEEPPAEAPPVREPVADEGAAGDGADEGQPSADAGGEAPEGVSPETEPVPDDVAAIQESLDADAEPVAPDEGSEVDGEVRADDPNATIEMPPVDGDESTSAESAAETPVADIDMGPERRGAVWVWIGLVAGVLIAAGAIGYAWWYTTSRPIPVPSIVGKLPAQAVQTINDVDLRLGKVTEVPTETAPPGTVVEQSPAAFTKLKPGAAVSFVLAAAPEGAKVPNVTGLVADEAAAELARARLTTRRVESFSSSAAAGFVMSQLPTAGAELPPGAVVALAVSKGPGPAQVRVPQLTGLTEADAANLLKAADLRGSIYRSFDASKVAGEVITQTPVPGAQIPYDSVVQYLVSQGPGTSAVTVPNLVGTERKAAQDRLKGLGLKSQVRQSSHPSVPKGQVISQMPPANSRAASGGVVGLLVSRGPLADGAVPSVLSTAAEEARKKLSAAGFSPVRIDIASSEHPAGQVFGQFPDPETQWPLRFPVLIVVATGEGS